jgi:hypothetical protein
VLMVMFQFPSTAISGSPQRFFAKPEWFWNLGWLPAAV